ncbi:MAG: alkaline phosphatase family protein [Planctomycetota bacterium]
MRTRTCFARRLFTLLPLLAPIAAPTLCACHVAREPDRASPESVVASAPHGRRTENVVLVLFDGLRWQEVFAGADAERIDAIGDEAERERVRREYWRDDVSDRRAVLMPFLWTQIATEGQVFGNVERGSSVRCANGLKFSYPGYSEMVVGFHDPRIDSNAKRENPNASVLEWLHGKPAFAGQVAVVGVWDVVPSIVRAQRSGLFVHAAFEPLELTPMRPTARLLNELRSDVTSPWDSMPYDAFAFHTAREVLDARSPRVLWVTFGETDEWAHAGDYARYLDAARRTDEFVARLWVALQAHARYRDRTTLLVSTDHGRGDGPRWTDHGKDVDGAEQIWIAALGPDTPALGERGDTPALTQGQIAATLAALLGEDWCGAEPRAAGAIRSIVAR